MQAKFFVEYSKFIFIFSFHLLSFDSIYSVTESANTHHMFLPIYIWNCTARHQLFSLGFYGKTKHSQNYGHFKFSYSDFTYLMEHGVHIGGGFCGRPRAFRDRYYQCYKSIVGINLIERLSYKRYIYIKVLYI